MVRNLTPPEQELVDDALAAVRRGVATLALIDDALDALMHAGYRPDDKPAPELLDARPAWLHKPPEHNPTLRELGGACHA